MFNLFKRKTPLEKLNSQYMKLMKEAHTLSTINREASDAKTAEANLILGRIEELKLK